MGRCGQRQCAFDDGQRDRQLVAGPVEEFDTVAVVGPHQPNMPTALGQPWQQRWRVVTVLAAGRGDHDDQQQAEGVDGV